MLSSDAKNITLQCKGYCLFADLSTPLAWELCKGRDHAYFHPFSFLL